MRNYGQNVAEIGKQKSGIVNDPETEKGPRKWRGPLKEYISVT
jgi:hypothetical protein